MGCAARRLTGISEPSGGGALPMAPVAVRPPPLPGAGPRAEEPAHLRRASFGDPFQFDRITAYVRIAVAAVTDRAVSARFSPGHRRLQHTGAGRGVGRAPSALSPARVSDGDRRPHPLANHRADDPGRIHRWLPRAAPGERWLHISDLGSARAAGLSVHAGAVRGGGETV